MIHLGDITKLNGAEIPVVDCITGGSPCQDLSIAGKRDGLKGERSVLFHDQVRIVKEMRQRERENGKTGKNIRPRYMVWENVPGALSSGSTKGADFAKVFEEIIKICEPDAGVCVCVCREADGQKPGAITLRMEPGALRGEYMMRNFSECPSVVVESRLSQILEECPPQKYYLSPKACQGILTRANRRGKKLPQELETALIAQSRCELEADAKVAVKGL